MKEQLEYNELQKKLNAKLLATQEAAMKFFTSSFCTKEVLFDYQTRKQEFDNNFVSYVNQYSSSNFQSREEILNHSQNVLSESYYNLREYYRQTINLSNQFRRT